MTGPTFEIRTRLIKVMKLTGSTRCFDSCFQGGPNVPKVIEVVDPEDVLLA